MVKGNLIAIAVVALLATSAQALGLDPHAGLHQSIKPNIPKMNIDWPLGYKALDLCVLPEYMHVGYLVDVAECPIDIKLAQVECGDIARDPHDWPCYLNCGSIRIRANFEVRLGLRLEKNKVGDNIIGGWKAYFSGDDLIAGDGSWHTEKVCVKAWKVRLQDHSPGARVQIGYVAVTVKPSV